MTAPATVNSIHFIGIAGTAMAAVAALCCERGAEVRGSDERIYPPMSTFLKDRGIPVREGYRAENLDPLPDLICIGNAIRRGNPEVERVLDERLPYCSLPELIRQELLRDVSSVVVAGTHGKTTTTSLLAWTLDVAGLAPGFLIGGIPLNFSSGARAARGKYFVIEGDEYDTAFFDKRSKFVHYRPDVVVLNNVEFDHADIFPDLAAVKRAFRQLLAIVPRRGCIIANGDDPNVRELVTDAPAPVRFFHRQDAANLPLSLAGDHNRSNAAAVLAAARYLGVDDATLARAFASFRGVKRRMEVRGEAGGVMVLDDFAHHPTALRVTLHAIRERYPGRRVWAVFEPRSNTTRRNVFQRELADALACADAVAIGRVNRAQELPAQERLDTQRLVADLQAAGRPATQADRVEDLVDQLCRQLRAGDIVAVFSNGDFDGLHDKLLTALRL